MENKILKKLYERIIRHFLDIIILSELKKKEPLSGYDIIGIVHNKFDILVSSGTVYALLYSLERKGLINGEWARKKRLYTLSDKGKSTLNVILKSKTNLKRFVQTLF